MLATITVTSEETRILVQDESGDRLQARLPALSRAQHPRALATLLEAMALWSGSKLRVVLCVDERFGWRQAGLADSLDFGLATLFFEVEFVPVTDRSRRRPKRLSGLGSFAGERSAGRRSG